jgi:putative DNA primase/helicase
MSDAEKIVELATRLDQARSSNRELITEDSAALAFTARYRDELLFDHDRGQWFRWTGTHWQCERTRLAFDWARALARDLADSIVTGKTSFASGVERFAQADRAHAVTSDDWDKNLFLLATPGGTVNLRTGELKIADPADRITRIAGVAPADTADCPRWLAFLSESTGNDLETIRFLQQFAGYCLTGATTEHALIFCYGDGGNGKTVLQNTIAGVLGDYAVAAAMETFTATRHEQHTTDLAMLRGARLVTAAETEEGRHWAENRIKKITGGDRLTARFMHRDNFSYTPQFKLVFIGNHQPNLHNVDNAVRRRFNMVPFTRKPAIVDKALEEKLRVEWPGILRWMVDGCLDWRRNGLIQSAAVMRATTEYFDAQDTHAQWLVEACDVEPANEFKTATAADLFASWTAFATKAGEPVGTQKALAARLKKQFTCSKATAGARIWKGLRLKVDNTRNDRDL